jgi:hypothetical protein
MQTIKDAVRSVDLSRRALVAVPPLTQFRALTTLDLSHNRLAALGPLPPTLTSLDASHNALASLAPLGALPALASVAFAHNRVETLDGAAPPGAAQHPALETLGLAHNRVRSLRGLGALASLISLDLRWNLLATTDEFQHAGRACRPKALQVEGCLVAGDPLHFERIAVLVPSLEEIDGRVVRVVRGTSTLVPAPAPRGEVSPALTVTCHRDAVPVAGPRGGGGGSGGGLVDWRLVSPRGEEGRPVPGYSQRLLDTGCSPRPEYRPSGLADLRPSPRGGGSFNGGCGGCGGGGGGGGGCGGSGGFPRRRSSAATGLSPGASAGFPTMTATATDTAAAALISPRRVFLRLPSGLRPLESERSPRSEMWPPPAPRPGPGSPAATAAAAAAAAASTAQALATSVAAAGTASLAAAALVAAPTDVARLGGAVAIQSESMVSVATTEGYETTNRNPSALTPDMREMFESTAGAGGPDLMELLAAAGTVAVRSQRPFVPPSPGLSCQAVLGSGAALGSGRAQAVPDLESASALRTPGMDAPVRVLVSQGIQACQGPEKRRTASGSEVVVAAAPGLGSELVATAATAAAAVADAAESAVAVCSIDLCCSTEPPLSQWQPVKYFTSSPTPTTLSESFTFHPECASHCGFRLLPLQSLLTTSQDDAPAESARSLLAPSAGVFVAGGVATKVTRSEIRVNQGDSRSGLGPLLSDMHLEESSPSPDSPPSLSSTRSSVAASSVWSARPAVSLSAATRQPAAEASSPGQPIDEVWGRAEDLPSYDAFEMQWPPALALSQASELGQLLDNGGRSGGSGSGDGGGWFTSKGAPKYCAWEDISPAASGGLPAVPTTDSFGLGWSDFSELCFESYCDSESGAGARKRFDSVADDAAAWDVMDQAERELFGAASPIPLPCGDSDSDWPGTRACRASESCGVSGDEDAWDCDDGSWQSGRSHPDRLSISKADGSMSELDGPCGGRRRASECSNEDCCAQVAVYLRFPRRAAAAVALGPGASELGERVMQQLCSAAGIRPQRVTMMRTRARACLTAVEVVIRPARDPGEQGALDVFEELAVQMVTPGSRLLCGPDTRLAMALHLRAGLGWANEMVLRCDRDCAPAASPAAVAGPDAAGVGLEKASSGRQLALCAVCGWRAAAAAKRRRRKRGAETTASVWLLKYEMLVGRWQRATKRARTLSAEAMQRAMWRLMTLAECIFGIWRTELLRDAGLQASCVRMLRMRSSQLLSTSFAALASCVQGTALSQCGIAGFEILRAQDIRRWLMVPVQAWAAWTAVSLDKESAMVGYARRRRLHVTLLWWEWVAVTEQAHSTVPQLAQALLADASYMDSASFARLCGQQWIGSGIVTSVQNGHHEGQGWNGGSDRVRLSLAALTHKFAAVASKKDDRKSGKVFDKGSSLKSVNGHSFQGGNNMIWPWLCRWRAGAASLSRRQGARAAATALVLCKAARASWTWAWAYLRSGHRALAGEAGLIGYNEFPGFPKSAEENGNVIIEDSWLSPMPSSPSSGPAQSPFLLSLGSYSDVDEMSLYG